jgi:hypothetical protein
MTMPLRLLLSFIFLLGLATGATAERVVLNPSADDVSVQVQESNATRTVIQFGVNAFDRNALVVNGETFYSITSGKESVLLEAGNPSLPHINRSIIIPDDARMSVRVLSSEYRDFPMSPVVPSKGNLLRTVDPKDVPYTFGSVYAGSQPYPAELATGGDPYIMRDYRAMVVEAHPFQYLPDSKTLRVYTSLVVEVTNVGTSSVNVYSRNRSEHGLVPEFDRIYQRRFINYDYQTNRYLPLQESGDMLIITYDAFASTMQPFVDWKRQKGIKTRMVNVSTIGNTSAAIKSFVQAYFDSTNLAWLLLVGDAAQIATPTASGGSSDPSYAKLLGGDSYPDIFVGRFSAENAAQAQTQVDRTLTYEKNLPTTDWLNKAAGVASASGPGHNGGEYDYQHMNVIRTDLLNYGYLVVDQIYDPGATAAMVSASLNAGRSFVNYTGHGATTSWTTTGFSNSNIATLTNVNKLPFIVSVACVNGEFDGYTCFAEGWLRATSGGNPTGALAAYMSSVNQSWNPPMDAQDECTDLIINNLMNTFGGICFNGSAKMIDINGADGILMYDTWHIFGDPSVQLRTAPPATMEVVHAPAIFFAASSYQVTVPGVPKALCALYTNGTLYGSAYTNALGQATIPISPMLPVGGQILLTITAYNKVTFVDTLQITADLAIIHTALTNTKNTTTPYTVDAAIYSNSPLFADSLLVYYRVGGIWSKDTMVTTTPENHYVGYIPPQPAGTVINYYIYARNSNGVADTTDVFTFKVIDYAMLVSPLVAAETAPVNDTVWYTETITNDGVLTDTYGLSLFSSTWNTSIWNAAGTAQVSSVGPLAKDQQGSFKVRVIVPQSANGASDIARVQVTSQANGTIQSMVTLTTYSAGQPLVVPFFDDFPATVIDTVKWEKIAGATVGTNCIAPPSGVYALNLNGNPSGADTVESDRINLRNYSGILVSYYYEKKGAGMAPSTGEDLIVEYLNNAGTWQPLRRHLGSDPDMTSFTLVQAGIPLDGYHAGFKLRFRNLATIGNYDDWFVDNVRIDYGPEIGTTPLTFNESVALGDSCMRQLVISNSGLGEMNYSLMVLPDFSKSTGLFGKLAAAGLVQPATTSVNVDWANYYEAKGAESTLRGPEVVYNAGGPDAFGYTWIDSDQPGGPAFNWIDIAATGTNVTGLTDDNFVGPFNIGFGFPYYDSTYTTFYISGNGFIGFGPTDGYGSLSNTTIPLTGAPNNMICWCWDDLNIADYTNPGGKVYYQVVGGNLVIQYEKYPRISAALGGTITAELVLSPNGKIVMQYETIGSPFNIQSNSVGIENKSGNMGLQVAFNTGYLHNGLVIQFDKPAQWLYLGSTSGVVPSGESNTIPLKFCSAGLDTGSYKAFVKIFSNDPDQPHNPWTVPATMTVMSPYTVGDASGDNVVDISDAVFTIAYIFSGGPAPVPLVRADATCDQIVDISDVVKVIAYIFAGGPAPGVCK